jgi:CrcB protein
MAALLVFVGGGLGALLRYLAALTIGGPLATLAVNVVGSFAIGLLAATQPLDPHPARQ